MTSPAVLHLSLDTDSISGASIATTAAEAVIWLHRNRQAIQRTEGRLMSGNTSQDRRVAVLTGRAGGIGGAIVARLAPCHTVVDLHRAGDVVVDLGDPHDVRRAARLVLDRHGRRDVFVHPAGTFEHASLDQVELDRAFDPAWTPPTSSV